MAKLEDIKVGSVVIGIIENEPVTIKEVTKYGNNGISLKYKDSNGKVYYQMLFTDYDDSIKIIDGFQPSNGDNHA